MKTRVLWISALVLGLVGSGWMLAQRAGPAPDERVGGGLSVSEILSAGSDSGFSRALEPRRFLFPADHGPHPSFRTEWWYLTGNLTGPEGEPYGFQFTLFRSALSPSGGAPDLAVTEGGSPGESPWRTRQVYMGHLAVTDGSAGTFHASELFSRGAGGLAGALASPFRVWLEDWRLIGPEDESGSIFPLRVDAIQDGTGLSLTMVPSKPLTLQGDRGLSQKGPEPGNASFYYSFTRLDSEGLLLLEGDTVAVKGLAWMDREWSTSALSAGQVGWDWFALQLSDGSDLMYYQLRRRDGSSDPLSKGILVDGNGVGDPIGSAEVRLTVLDRWKSPLDGTPYPALWSLSIPSQELTLDISPLVPDQELNLTFRYWEGAVRVSGTRGDVPVEGRGYVELTGYADLEVPPGN